MKQLFFAALLLLAPAARAQTPVRLPLKSVTLYLNGAELHHEGSISLPAGTTEVRIAGLSPFFKGGADVQVEAQGAELEDVQFGSAMAAGTTTPGTLADSLRTAQQTQRRLQTEETMLAAETEFLQQNKLIERIKPGKWAAEVQQAAAYYSQRLGILKERSEAVKTQFVVQSALVSSLSQRLGLQPATAGVAQTVLLRLRLVRAGTVQLAAVYNLGNGTIWVPEYELRVSEPNLTQLRVVSRAQLYNQTGLPWENMPVVLHTTAQLSEVSRPDLNPWLVRFKDNNEDTESDGEGRLDRFAVKGTMSNGPGTAATSGSESADLGSRLALPEPVTLPSGANRTVRLAEQTLPMRLEYLAIPKALRQRQVFLVGRVADWYQVNFLNSTAKVFFRGAYVGTTNVETRAYTDTLEVSLGRDPQIAVTRTKREDFETPVAGNRTKTRLRYEITVRNNHPYPVRLRLLDQVPVSQEKEISVKIQEISSAVLDGPSGKLRWLLNLPAGAIRRFTVAFTVEAPTDKDIDLRQGRNVHHQYFR